MSDKYHFSVEQDLYDCYNTHRQSTESPTTTSSASSPMTAVAPSHFNWQPFHNASTSIDPTMVNQFQHFDYAMPAQQTRTSYLQQLSYINPYPMQGNTYPDPYARHPQQSNQHIHSQQSNNNNQYSIGIPTNETISHRPQENYIPTIKLQHTIPCKKKNLKIKKYNSPSPKSTPLPSPNPLKRKRGESRRSSVGSSHSGERMDRNKKKTEDEGANFVIPQVGDVNQRTVDQLENELAFLRDECATILIMLDSLRNAFITDMTDTVKDTAKKKTNTLPLTGTIDFMDSHHMTTSSTTHLENRKKVIPVTLPAKPISPNPDMEREMRIAYDDLMLQVRQLEKKVEKLEKKSKSAYLPESTSSSKSKVVEEYAEYWDQPKNILE